MSRPALPGWIPLPLLALGVLLPDLPWHLRSGDSSPVPGVFAPAAWVEESVPDLGPEPDLHVRRAGAPGAPWESEALRGEVERLLARAGWRTARWGILAVSLDRGDTLFALEPERPLAPASNLKLFTTAAALHRLGPDFRVPTFLLADGEILDGVLHGDLILYGTGDPALAGGPSAEAPEGALAHFLEAVRSWGIQEVHGSIVGDGTFFRGDPRRPSWNPRDLNEWYAAPASALSFNENLVTLEILPGVASGAPPRTRLQPDGVSVPLRNLARTVNGTPSPGLLLVRDDPGEPIELRGEIRGSGPAIWRSVTVSDPPLYAASYFRQVLLHGGISVTGPARKAEAEGPLQGRVSSRTLAAPAFGERPSPRVVAVHHSPPLPDLLEVVNKRSHNLYADLLLFTLGHLLEDDPTFEGGGRAIQAFLTEEVGIPAEELHIEDGSGLSRLNRATPAAMVRLLEHMSLAPSAELYWASLPEAGNRQELRRMERTPAAGNLRAKTGTIHRTSALSGIVRTGDGERVLFSIIVNDVPSPWAAKQVEDRIGAALAGFRRPDGLLPEALPSLQPAQAEVQAEEQIGPES